MVITDAQVHLWPREDPARPWPEAQQVGRTRFPLHEKDTLTAEEMLAMMDEASVARAVVVPPSFAGDDNEFALQAAEQYPDRLAVTGRIDLGDVRARRELGSWVTAPGMLGLRLTFHRPPTRGWLEDGTADWLWRYASEHHVPLCVYAPGQLTALAGVAARYPETIFVVDHLGLDPGWRGPEVDRHIESLIRLADSGNVAVKASGVVGSSTDGHPFRSVQPVIRRVVGAFGADRVLWGSDVTRIPSSYHDAVRLFTEELDFLSGPELESVMGGALERWLGWPSDAPRRRREGDGHRPGTAREA